MTDKGDTFIFKPEQPEEKEKITRTDVDEFTIARKVRKYDEEEKSSSLPYIAATLGALVVIAIAFLIIFLSADKEEAPQEIPQQNQEVTVPEDKEEKEETAPIINAYTLGYNGGKIYELENGGYSIVFEEYNHQGSKIGTQKFYINSDTVIKDQGIKIQLGAFVNFIENQAGEIIILDCTVNEDESTLLTINYSSSGYGEEEEIVEEEIPETPESPENEEEPPASEGFSDESTVEETPTI